MSASTTEFGVVRLKFAPASPLSIVNTAIAPFKNQIAEKEIRLDVSVPSQGPEITADIAKVSWVLTNFLNNAIRYTPRWGKIAVMVKHKDNTIVFTVQDSGNGITPENLERIFETTLNADNDTFSTGMGLALAISKEFILAHNGEIWAESELGKGSRFNLKLPVTI